jgi:protein-S-isoprenylcysteine O-methyltransferase Ste14
MDSNGKKRPEQEDDFEPRLYQVLALVERTVQQHKAAADILTRAAALELRLDQTLQSASDMAAERIAAEIRHTLDGALVESTARLNQAAQNAVAAAEQLRWPWWFNLMAILFAGVLGALCALWVITPPAAPAAAQPDQRTRQLIEEGQMLEQIWPKLTPAQRKRFAP